MALNYYEGWTEKELLDERKLVQRQLSQGRITEIRLVGELTKTDDGNAAPLEITLERIAYALYKLDSTTYANPFGETGVTLQRFA